MTITLEHPDDERFHIENVEPLIVSVEQRGDKLEFVFRCPITGFESTVRVRPGYHGPPEPSESQASRLYGLLENALRPTSETTKISADAGAAWTVPEIEEAACDAFESVSGDFLWDGMRWTYWEAEDKVVEFLEYSDALEDLTAPQRAVLQKVLAAVAQADGKVESSEEQLLQTLLNLENAASGNGELPTHQELLSINTKTMACAVVAFGYAIACVDGHLSAKEDRILDLVCSRFGLGTLKQWELKRIAQAFCVDEIFGKAYQSGNPTPKDRVEVYRFAKGLAIPQPETRQIEWRFLKRSGLA